MKFMVTGGAGFVGSHIVKKLCQQNHDVLVFAQALDWQQPSTPSLFQLIYSPTLINLKKIG